MKTYRVTGRFEMGWIKNQDFVKEIAAASPEEAKEAVFSVIGSRHKAKRRQIKINTVEEVPIDQIIDPVVKKRAGGEK